MQKRLLKECLRIAVAKNNPKTHPEWGSYHHFSFIVQDNKLIEWGTNHPGTPPKYLGYDKMCKIHSEHMAFKRAKGLLKKDQSFDIINIRLNKTNEIRMSAPCKCCYSFLRNEGCRKVWFTTNLGWANL